MKYCISYLILCGDLMLYYLVKDSLDSDVNLLGFMVP